MRKKLWIYSFMHNRRHLQPVHVLTSLYELTEEYHVCMVVISPIFLSTFPLRYYYWLAHCSLLSCNFHLFKVTYGLQLQYANSVTSHMDLLHTGFLPNVPGMEFEILTSSLDYLKRRIRSSLFFHDSRIEAHVFKEAVLPGHVSITRNTMTQELHISVANAYTLVSVRRRDSFRAKVWGLVIVSWLIRNCSSWSQPYLLCRFSLGHTEGIRRHFFPSLRLNSHTEVSAQIYEGFENHNVTFLSPAVLLIIVTLDRSPLSLDFSLFLLSFTEYDVHRVTRSISMIRI